MWYKPQRTWAKPSAQNQAGQPSPGDGAQTMGYGLNQTFNGSGYTSTTAPPVSADFQPPVNREPVRPTKGKRTWLRPSSPRGEQQGMPSPLDATQRRPLSGPGAMDNVPPQFGGNIAVWTPYYSRGAAAYVQNYGKVLYNPIGAGVQVLSRPQASYGPSGQYIDGEIFWTSQVVPTTITPQSLTDPQELADILDPLTVYAVARVNG
jgi:hypothetical protein